MSEEMLLNKIIELTRENEQLKQQLLEKPVIYPVYPAYPTYPWWWDRVTYTALESKDTWGRGQVGTDTFAIQG